MMYISLIGKPEFDFLLHTVATELTAGDTYIELGSFLMGTIGRLASSFPNIDCHAIDIGYFKWMNEPNEYLESLPVDVRWSENFAEETIKWVLAQNPNISFHREPTRRTIFPNAKLQFIDANHGYQEVLADFWYCWNQAALGSLIVGDDYDAEVIPAVHEISKVLKRQPDFPAGRLWSFRKT